MQIGRRRMNVFGPVLALGATLTSCAGFAIEVPGAREVMRAEPQPRCVWVVLGELSADLEARRETLRDGVLFSLKENFNAATVVTEGSQGADMKVSLTITKGDEPSARRYWNLAATEFLLFPLSIATWWVGDVFLDVDMKLGITVQKRESIGGEWKRQRELRPRKVPEIVTSLRDRQPLISWATLGALFFPGLAFAASDKDHVQETIAKRLHVAIAMEVAREIKQPLGEELLTDLSIEWEPTTAGKPATAVLTCSGSPDLWHVIVYDGAKDRLGAELGRARMPLNPTPADLERQYLSFELPRQENRRLVRVEAVSRLESDRHDFYSLWLPGTEAQPRH